MGRHRAGRASLIPPFTGSTQRVAALEETRGRLFGRKPEVPAAQGSLDFGSAVSITQAMEILERIAARRAEHVGVPLGFVDRIQVLP